MLSREERENLRERVFRVVRAIRAVRLLVFGSRGAAELIERLRRRRFGKLAVVSGFVILIGAALLYLSEEGQGSPINSFGDALYWTTIMVVGTEGGLEMRTPFGRLITLGLIGYSIVVVSYLVGAIASLWVERDREERGLVKVEGEVGAVRQLAICLTGLVVAIGAVACKPGARHEAPATPMRLPPLEMPAYGACPPKAENCDPERLRVLQDSLAAMEKRHRSLDSLGRLLTPPLDFRYHPPPEGALPLRPWRGPEWERRAPMDEDRRGLGLPPGDSPRARRTSNP